MKTAKFYPFDHVPAPDSCWSVSTGPDGRIYAASCCESVPGGGVYMVRYDDETDSIETLVDLPEVTGQPRDSGRATQCKIHYSFAASRKDGIMYAATHLSAPGVGQKRYRAWGEWKNEATSFPHSVLVAYDTGRDEVAWTDTFIPREGCRCLALAEEQGLLYAIGYPRDHFWVYDLAKRTMRSLGRLGSVNSQTIFTDRRGRAYMSNCHGQFVRYTPETDLLEEIPIFVPHSPDQTGWHDVLYDVVASPEGDCVYGVPWNTNPHMFRYWPEDGPYGRIEDLGPVHQQDRDRTFPIPFFLDHCGGLVFGVDGMLYFGTSRWQPRAESAFLEGDQKHKPEGIIVRMDTRTLEKTDFARVHRPDGQGHYVSRGARDRHGNLFFGQVVRPIPAGFSRLEMNETADNAHLPLRTWG